MTISSPRKKDVHQQGRSVALYRVKRKEGPHFFWGGRGMINEGTPLGGKKENHPESPLLKGQVLLRKNTRRSHASTLALSIPEKNPSPYPKRKRRDRS